jgi:hypothetical protein
MAKNKTFYAALISLSLAAGFLSGCAYLTHLKEVIFLKDLESNQKQMQAALDKEEELYSKLKADIDSGTLKKLTKKRAIVHLYGEPVLCQPPETQDGIKEVCIYRKPTGGLFGAVILLNFDAQDRLCSWQFSDLGK